MGWGVDHQDANIKRYENREIREFSFNGGDTFEKADGTNMEQFKSLLLNKSAGARIIIRLKTKKKVPPVVPRHGPSPPIVPAPLVVVTPPPVVPPPPES